MSCLVIDACARIDSRTRKFGNEFLRKNQYKNINVINLYNLGLRPIDEDLINERDYLIANKLFDADMFYLANQFAKSDIIIIEEILLYQIQEIIVLWFILIII